MRCVGGQCNTLTYYPGDAETISVCWFWTKSCNTTESKLRLPSPCKLQHLWKIFLVVLIFCKSGMTIILLLSIFDLSRTETLKLLTSFASFIISCLLASYAYRYRFHYHNIFQDHMIEVYLASNMTTLQTTRWNCMDSNIQLFQYTVLKAKMQLHYRLRTERINWMNEINFNGSASHNSQNFEIGMKSRQFYFIRFHATGSRLVSKCFDYHFKS